MSKPKTLSTAPVFVPKSQLVWTDEKLQALDRVQLGNLLDNLGKQLASGRVSEETAADLQRRIEARLPARELALRKKRQAQNHPDTSSTGL
jgi:hypothetical protein